VNRVSGRSITFKHVAIGVGAGFLLGVVTMSYFSWRMTTATPQVTVVPSAAEPSLVTTPRDRGTPTPKDIPANPPTEPTISAAQPPVPATTPVAATAPPATVLPPTAAMASAEGELRNRKLDLPVKGAARSDLRDSFNDARDGERAHEAIDILAPRNTPVLAVEDGKVVKLFLSKAGGITIYQFDPSSQFVYYYAHLERYADGLAESAKVLRGQVIGYVGTSGNAPKNTPHLHFAIFQLDEKKQWWKGTPLDPYPILK
jgi:murein DD-endopeptidase MepM/ murein hydrolase activator NlpD